MATWTPAQLRVALSGYIAGLTPTAAYYRATTDAWTASQEPLSPDMAPQEAPLQHLLYSVDIRQAIPKSHDGSITEVPVSIWFLVDLAQLGTGARMLNWDRGLEAARILWRHLQRADRLLPDLTVGTSGILYRLQPLLPDWALGEVRITVLCNQPEV